MSRTPKIFLSKHPHPRQTSELISLCRDSLPLLFPGASEAPSPDEKFSTASTVFFQEGPRLVWTEIFGHPFSRSDVCDYMAKAREIQLLVSSPLGAVLMAPDFEPGVRELLELIEIPIRCYRYEEVGVLGAREAPQELLRSTLLWVQPVTTFGSKSVSDPSPLPPSKVTVEPPRTDPPGVSQRLSREELREFIELELDTVSHKIPSREKNN